MACKGTQQSQKRHHDQKPSKNLGLLIGRKCLGCHEGVARLAVMVEVRLVGREGNLVVKGDLVACWMSFLPRVWWCS